MTHGLIHKQISEEERKEILAAIADSLGPGILEYCWAEECYRKPECILKNHRGHLTLLCVRCAKKFNRRKLPNRRLLEWIPGDVRDKSEEPTKSELS